MKSVRSVLLVSSLLLSLCSLHSQTVNRKTPVPGSRPSNLEKAYKITPGGDVRMGKISDKDLRRVIDKPASGRELNWNEANHLRLQLNRVKSQRKLTPEESFLQDRLSYFTGNYKAGKIAVDPQDATLLKRVMDDNVVFQDPLYRDLDTNVSADGQIPLSMTDRLSRAIYKVSANRDLTPAELQLQQRLERNEYDQIPNPNELPRMSDTMKNLVRDHAMLEAGYKLKIDAVDNNELNQLENLLGD